MPKSARVCLGPDMLDQMSADDPRAIASRQDIKRINAVMFQDLIMRGAIERCGLTSPRRVLDLGGGDGTFTLKVARKLRPHWRGAELVILDRMKVVEPQTVRDFEKLGVTLKVVSGDVFAILESSPEPFDLVLSNLFIHHFQTGELSRLLSLISRLTKGFVACEPKRSALSIAGSSMLWTIGCTAVSVHDSVTGARAGFTGREVADHWPDKKGWDLDEYDKGLFSHCFTARKRTIM